MPKNNKTSWKPGQSGNPNGRPRKGETLKEQFEKVLEEEYVRTLQNGTKEPTGFKKKEILAEAIFRFAISGSATHANIILDRVYGRVPIRVDAPGMQEAMSMTDEQYKSIMQDLYNRKNRWKFDEKGNPVEQETTVERKRIEGKKETEK